MGASGGAGVAHGATHGATPCRWYGGGTRSSWTVTPTVTLDPDCCADTAICTAVSQTVAQCQGTDSVSSGLSPAHRSTTTVFVRRESLTVFHAGERRDVDVLYATHSLCRRSPFRRVRGGARLGGPTGSGTLWSKPGPVLPPRSVLGTRRAFPELLSDRVCRPAAHPDRSSGEQIPSATIAPFAGFTLPASEGPASVTRS